MPSFSVNPLTFRTSKLDTARQRSEFLQKLGDLLSQITASPGLSGTGGGGGGGGGGGDMLKSTYDTNNNGVVDTADSLAYSKLTGVPASFPPSAHASTHLYNGTDSIAALVPRAGTTGQVLQKNSASDYDAIWVTPTTETQVQWYYRTTLTMADPGSGNLRLNNALAGSATQMAISRFGSLGNDRYNLFKSLQPGDVILVEDATNVANWIRYQLSAIPTDNTTWFLLTFTVVVGSGTTPSNNDLLTLTFTIAGGAGGGAGDMYKATYDTNNNGVVDTCDSLAYSKLTGAPTIPTVGTLTTQQSITGGGSMTGNLTINLVGDVVSPGNSYFYGTGTTGTRGWYALPAAGTTWTPITYQASGLAANTSIPCDNATSVNIFISISAGITLTLTHLPVGVGVNVRVGNTAASAQTIKLAATDPSGTAYAHVYSYDTWTTGSGETDMVATGRSIAASGAVMFAGGTSTGAAFGTVWACNY